MNQTGLNPKRANMQEHALTAQERGEERVLTTFDFKQDAKPFVNATTNEILKT